MPEACAQGHTWIHTIKTCIKMGPGQGKHLFPPRLSQSTSTSRSTVLSKTRLEGFI